jgi:hypothetical protein
MLIDTVQNIAPNRAVIDLEARYGAASNRLIAHTELIETLDLARQFNADQSLIKGDYLRAQFDSFAEAASWMPGYQGVFGTGYPFYAEREDGTVVAIDEIDRFVGTIRDKAASDEMRGVGAWVCGACQVATEHRDLKERCRPCVDTTLKPRDVFKALPDLDFWVIVDENNPYIEGLLQTYMQRAGFQQSDADIYYSIKDTKSVLEGLQQGEQPEKRLPIDLHVITVSQLKQALTGVQDAVKTGDMYVPIAPRSLHVVWETVDEPYDFMKDFIFSFTPKDIAHEELGEMITETRKLVLQHIGPKLAEEVVKSAHPKERRQLGTPELGKLLLDRIESWKQ